METRNLRKERIGVVFSDKMDKTVTVAVNGKRNTLYMGSSLIKRRNFTPMMRRMIVTLVTLCV